MSGCLLFILGWSYQPLMTCLDIRRCPLLDGNDYNRHTPVTERSVALHAPQPAQVPTFSRWIEAPRILSDWHLVGTKVLVHARTLGCSGREVNRDVPTNSR